MNEDNGQPPNDHADDHRHDPLVHLLRAADPAADDELGAVERAEMRRSALAAAEAAKRRSSWAAGEAWMKPALATAALIVAGGIAFLLLVDGAMRGPGGVADTSMTANGTDESAEDRTAGDERVAAPEDVRPSDELQPDELQVGETTETPSKSATAGARPAPIEPTVADAPAARPALDATTGTETNAVAAATGAADRPRRTLQFTAPGGTRIIWTLDPSFESPIDGQPRQE